MESDLNPEVDSAQMNCEEGGADQSAATDSNDIPYYKLKGFPREVAFWKSKGFSDKEAREKASQKRPRNSRYRHRGGRSHAASTASGDAVSSSNAAEAKDNAAASADEVILINIYHANHPEEKLATEQQKAIQEKVLELVLAAVDIKPKFADCKFLEDHLTFSCKNRETAEWLNTAIHEVKIEGVALKTVEEKEVLHPFLFQGTFADSEKFDNDTILKYIDKQNSGLNALKWSVLKRTVVAEGTLLLVFGVSMNCFDKLKNMKFDIDFLFGTVKLNRPSDELMQEFKRPVPAGNTQKKQAPQKDKFVEKRRPYFQDRRPQAPYERRYQDRGPPDHQQSNVQVWATPPTPVHEGGAFSSMYSSLDSIAQRPQRDREEDLFERRRPEPFERRPVASRDYRDRDRDRGRDSRQPWQERSRFRH